ncbi:MAG: nodulation protein NfeD [Geminicoccaceae bacterium]|nr:nodulation protein NfeD [Geminicoccaceae bacterium]
MALFCLTLACFGEVGAADGRALLLDIDGPIGPATSAYVENGLDEAREEGASLVVLRLDTPGGLDTSMRSIVKAVLASPVPVASWVAPGGARAASAGTYILYASHVAAMAPGTNLGAATPVRLGPGGGAPDAATDPHAAKAVNGAVAYIRGLADLRGRDADWAEAAVRQAASLPATTAAARGVVDFVASSLPDLLRWADGRRVRVGGETVTLATTGLEVVPYAPSWRTRLLAIITNPDIAFLLILLGICGLVFELATPGIGVGGVAGGIGLVAGLYALALLPVDLAGAALLLLGIGLMVAEALTPSFGVLGLGGAAGMAFGATLLFDAGVPGFAVSPGVILAATVLSAGLLSVVLAVVVRAQRRPESDGTDGIGRVLEWNGTEGWVLVHGERWRARSSVPLLPDQRVRVTGREGLVLTVADPKV